MPNDAYEAWWHFFVEYGQRILHRKEQAEHDADMDAVRKALMH